MFTVYGFVAETIPICQPAFVDVSVFDWQNTLNFVTQGLNTDIGAKAVMGANAFVIAQFPGTCREPEWLGCQRTHRAEIDDIAGNFGINGSIQESADFYILTATRCAHFHYPGDFFSEAVSSRAVGSMGCAHSAIRYSGAGERMTFWTKTERVWAWSTMPL